MPTANVSVEGKSIPFLYAQGENVHRLVADILTGKTYPRIDFLAPLVSTVLDVGANVGAASIFLSQCFPQARVVAYEPTWECFSTLNRNVGPIERISTVHGGLMDKDGTAQIILGGSGCEGSSLFPGLQADGPTERIRLYRAADEFRRVAGEQGWVALKIDTEGCEIPILRDLEPHLSRVAVAYLEYHSEADRRSMDAIMAAAGMTLYSSSADHPHRGELAYVRESLMAEHTKLGDYAISPPA